MAFHLFFGRRRRGWRVAVAAGLLLAVSACSYKIEITQGDARLPEKMAAVEIGMSQAEVAALLGQPQIKHIFRENVWIYLYKKRDPGFVGTDRLWSVKLSFDEANKLTAITELKDEFGVGGDGGDDSGGGDEGDGSGDDN